MPVEFVPREQNQCRFHDEKDNPGGMKLSFGSGPHEIK